MAQTIILQGVILNIFPTEKHGDFYKRVFWLQEVNPEIKYPSTWALELWHDDTEDLNLHKVGSPIKCTVEVIGKLLKRRASNEDFIINILMCMQIEKAVIKL